MSNYSNGVKNYVESQSLLQYQPKIENTEDESSFNSGKPNNIYNFFSS